MVVPTRDQPVSLVTAILRIRDTADAGGYWR